MQESLSFISRDKPSGNSHPLEVTVGGRLRASTRTGTGTGTGTSTGSGSSGGAISTFTRTIEDTASSSSDSDNNSRYQRKNNMKYTSLSSYTNTSSVSSTVSAAVSASVAAVHAVFNAPESAPSSSSSCFLDKPIDRIRHQDNRGTEILLEIKKEKSKPLHRRRNDQVENNSSGDDDDDDDASSDDDDDSDDSNDGDSDNGDDDDDDSDDSDKENATEKIEDRCKGREKVDKTCISSKDKIVSDKLKRAIHPPYDEKSNKIDQKKEMEMEMEIEIEIEDDEVLYVPHARERRFQETVLIDIPQDEMISIFEEDRLRELNLISIRKKEAADEDKRIRLKRQLRQQNDKRLERDDKNEDDKEEGEEFCGDAGVEEEEEDGGGGDEEDEIRKRRTVMSVEKSVRKRKERGMSETYLDDREGEGSKFIDREKSRHEEPIQQADCEGMNDQSTERINIEVRPDTLSSTDKRRNTTSFEIEAVASRRVDKGSLETAPSGSRRGSPGAASVSAGDGSVQNTDGRPVSSHRMHDVTNYHIHTIIPHPLPPHLPPPPPYPFPPSILSSRPPLPPTVSPPLPPPPIPRPVSPPCPPQMPLPVFAAAAAAAAVGAVVARMRTDTSRRQGFGVINMQSNDTTRFNYQSDGTQSSRNSIEPTAYSSQYGSNVDYDTVSFLNRHGHLLTRNDYNNNGGIDKDKVGDRRQKNEHRSSNSYSNKDSQERLFNQDRDKGCNFSNLSLFYTNNDNSDNSSMYNHGNDYEDKDNKNNDNFYDNNNKNDNNNGNSRVNVSSTAQRLPHHDCSTYDNVLYTYDIKSSEVAPPSAQHQSDNVDLKVVLSGRETRTTLMVIG